MKIKNAKLSLVILIIMLAMAISGTVAAQDTNAPHIIGNLNNFGYPDFAEEMASLGYVEGENLTTLYLDFEDVDPNLYFENPEEWQRIYEAKIQEMVDAGAEVFTTNTDTDAVNLQALVGDVPIVFGRSDDPVLTGAVQSLLNPGGTMTGTITNKPHERRLQILKEIRPDTDAIYYLYNPMLGNTDALIAEVEAVATNLDIKVYFAPIPDLPTGLETLANTPEDVDWLFLTPLVLLWEPSWNETVINTSLERGIGSAYILGTPAQGWTMGYGPTIPSTDRQVAQIVDLILRGASPADIPVRNAENFMFVNLEAAEAIGLEFPLGIMRQADFVARPGDFADPTEGETAP